VRCLDGLSAAGASWLVVHQAPSGRPDNEVIPPGTTDTIGELCEAARQRGMGILVENFVGFSAALCVRLCDEVRASNLGIVLDLGHAHHTPLDVAAEVRAAAPHLRSLHAHDNHGAASGDEHLPPGYGTIRWRSVIRTLHEVGYGGPFIMEVIPLHEITRGRPPEELAAMCYEAAVAALAQAE
jgi:sugar phosphate isomerase/epimerase